MNFQNEVIEASKKKPILVDFWADWCQPCLILGPILDELANENKQRFSLVKVDTQTNQELAMKYGIRGIPAVKLFFNGEIIDEFVGLMPKTEIEKWLNLAIPSKSSKELANILEESEVSNKIKLLEDFLSAYKDDTDAKVELARIIVYADPDKAKTLVEGLNWDRERFDEAQDVRHIARLMTSKFESNSKIDEQMKTAQDSLKMGNFDQALDHLIQAVVIDKNYMEELPRLAVISIFHLLGHDNELSQKHRKAFDMALY